MTTVETLVKVKGDTSQFQSVLTKTTKTLDRLMDQYKKRLDTFNRLKINPKIGITDNATDALKWIEGLSNQVKRSLSLLPVTIDLSAVEQEFAKLADNVEKRMKDITMGVLPHFSVLDSAAQTEEVREVQKKGEGSVGRPTPKTSGNSEIISEKTGQNLAYLVAAPPYFIAFNSLIEKIAPKLGRFGPGLKLFGPAGLLLGGMNIVRSDDKGKATAELIGGIIGASLGGAAAGFFTSGIGVPAGVVGGNAAGIFLAGSVYDKVFGKKDEIEKSTDRGNLTDDVAQKSSSIATTQVSEKVLSKQQETMATVGQVYLDSQNKITTSNGFVINSQDNLMQAFTTLVQAVDFASAKLIAFSGIQLLPKEVDGHANGGILYRPHLGLVAEAGPEAIIPLSSRMRSRALGLWQQAGEYLGVRPYATGGLVGIMPTPIVAGGGVNVTVPVNVNLQVSSENIDYETIKNEVGWRIAKSVKNALENKVG
ncbi:hypothetical protein [Desulforamulus aeronauticus]|uniref:Uncharacterized protein n=1 Tax=Desulforamulus aeronauticus DSM 10349 TaxID=1121421 RepID=A0A1M6WGI2_9FIRM|nr:hypothetical protein [Desulforamulus aeronauticus]SHK92892.1 hypothetical protein SAMN02745123_03625 [Desulforamulus aeronauticus DSM 10349]